MKKRMTCKKLKRIGKSLMSTLLVLTMLLTTFCFFDIGSVLSEALILTESKELKNASETSSNFSTYNINFTEMIYMGVNVASAKYYLNNNTDGSVVSGYSEAGTFYFKCRTSTAVTVSAQLMSSDLSGVASDGNYIKSITFADGQTASGQNSDGLTVYTSESGSFNTKISSMTFRNSVTSTNSNQKEYIIKWTVKYTCDGKEYTTYAYSGVYAPNINAAMMGTKDRRVRNSYNTACSVAFSILTGAHKYGGGNCTMDTSKILPLNGLSVTQTSDLSALKTSTFPTQSNGGVFIQENDYEYNSTVDNDDLSVSDTNSRTYKTWNYPGTDISTWKNYATWTGYGDYDNPTTDQTKKTTIFHANANGETVNERLTDSGYSTNTYSGTTGVAYILVDSSRFTNYNQIPYLSAGFVGNEVTSHGNLMEISSISTDPRSDVPNGEITCSAAATNIYNDCTTKGLYALDGNVTAGFKLIGYRFRTYRTGLADKNILVVTHTLGLHTTTVDRSTLRELYYKYLMSGVNTSDTENWDSINTMVQEIVKKLCTTSGQDCTLSFSESDFTSKLSASKKNLQSAMATGADQSGASAPIVLLAPEVIYLYPDGESANLSVATPFQYFIENDVDVDDIYESVNTKTTAEKTGHIYFATPNAEAGTITLSYRWLDRDYETELSSKTDGWIKFSDDTNALYSSSASGYYNNKSLTMDSKSNVASCEIVRDDSLSPTLDSTKTGAVIEWLVRFYDTVDGYEKAITAYTYVYKPYVQPLACGTDVYYWKYYASSIGWMSGFHDIDAASGVRSTYEDDGDASDKTRELYYPIFTGENGVAAFVSEENIAYIGGNRKEDNGSTARTDIGAVSGTASNGYAIFTGKDDNQHVRFNHDGANDDPDADQGNKSPDDYGSSTANTSTTYPKKSYQFVYSNAEDLSIVKNYNASKGKIYIDTSRYSNLSQIPNLSVGLTVTNDGGSTGNSAGWYVASYTDCDLNGEISRRDGFDTDDYLSGVTSWDPTFNDHGDLIAYQLSEGQTGKFTFVETEGIRYAGDWIEDIQEKNETKTYSIKTVYMNNHKYSSWGNTLYCQGMGSSVMDLEAVQLNKQKLREALNLAIRNIDVLGVYDKELDSYYFEGSTYDNFKKYYHDAYAALTILDGTYSTYTSQTAIDTLANNLTDTVAALVGGKDHSGAEQPGGVDLEPLNVQQIDVGITELASGKFQLEYLDSHETTVMTRDTVYYSKDEFEGYTYSGAIRFSTPIAFGEGDTLTSDNLQGMYMSSTQYDKYIPTVSNGNLSLAIDTSITLLQMRDNNGVVVEDKTSDKYGDITYNWSTRHDGDMYLYYFYVKNQYTTYFDLNYNNIPVNVAPVGEYSTASDKLYTIENKTISGVSVTYDFETDIITLNGTLTGSTGTFFSTIMNNLSGGTYTDCLFYVGGKAYKPSGKHMTVTGDRVKPNSDSRISDETVWNDYFPAGNQSSSETSYTEGIVFGSNTYAYDGSLNHIRFWSWCETEPTSDNGLVYKFENFQLRYQKVAGSTVSSAFSPNARISFYGEQLLSMPRPVRTDYEFLGWFTDPVEGSKVDSSKYVTEGDRTLYAHWRARNRELRLDNEFDFNAWTESNIKISTDMEELKKSASGVTATITTDAYGDAMLCCRGTTDGYIKTGNLTFDGTDTVVSMDINIIDLVSSGDGYCQYIRVKDTSGNAIDGIEEVTYKDTTIGTVNATINIPADAMASGTQYYVEVGTEKVKLSQYEIAQFCVVNYENTTIFSTDYELITNCGTTVVSKSNQSVLIKADEGKTDIYTDTFNRPEATRYRIKLEKKENTNYTFSFDYHVLTDGVSTYVNPYLFFYTEGAAEFSTLMMPRMEIKGTGSYSCEFDLPAADQNYIELRFGIEDSASDVQFTDMVIQETKIYEQSIDGSTAAYSTRNNLGGLTTTEVNTVSYYGQTHNIKIMTTDKEGIRNDVNYWEKFNVRFSRVGVDETYDGIEVPVRTGYIFKGWYTEPGGKGKQITDGDGNAVSDTKVTEDIVLYSQWVKAIYQLLYDNDFSFENWNSTVAYRIDAYQNEQRDSFDNSITLTGRGTSQSPRTNEYSMTLIKGHTYELTFDVENDTKTTDTGNTLYCALPKVMYDTGSGSQYPSFNNNQFLKPGESGKFTTTFTMSSETLKLYFYHSAYGDGKQAWGYDGVDGMLNGASVTYKDITIRDLTDPLNIRSTDKEDTALTTKLKDVNYSETFGELPSTKDDATDENNISRVGYTFKGWFSGQNSQGNGYGTQYTSDTAVPFHDTQMFAQWELNNPTISINLNGTAKNTASMGKFTYGTSSLDASTGTVKSGTSVEVAATTSNSDAVTTTITPYYSSTVTLPIPTMTGFTFNGWVADTTPTYAVLNSNDENSPSTYKVGDGNATLTAQWVKNDYTISYVMNNGTNNSANVDTGKETKSCEFDTAYEIKKPTKAGWVFEGWELTTDTAGYATACYYTTNPESTTAITDKTYFGKSDDSIYIIDLTPTKGYTVTMTAHWSKKITAEVHTISPTTFDETLTKYPQTIKDSETSATFMIKYADSVTMDGVTWYFTGWRTDTDSQYPQVKLESTSYHKPTLEATTDDDTVYKYYATYNSSYKIYFTYYDGSETTYEPSKHVKVNTQNYLLACKVNEKYPTGLYATSNGQKYSEDWTPTKTCDGATFSKWEDTVVTDSTLKRAIYVKDVSLTYNLNDDSKTPASFQNTVTNPQTQQAYYKSDNGKATANNNTFTVTTEIPQRKGCLFLGWGVAEDDEIAAYVGGQSFTSSTSSKIDDTVLYAIWLVTEYADEAKDSEIPKETVAIERGFDEDGKQMTAETVFKYTQDTLDVYDDAVTAYNNAYSGYIDGRSDKSKNKNELLALKNTLVDCADVLVDALDALVIKPLQTQYFNNFYAVDGKQHSVADMNLNHYMIAVLNSVKTAKTNGEALIKDTTKTIEDQATLNTYVLAMAEGFKNRQKAESSSPVYSVSETTDAVKTALNSSDDIYGVNYVYSGKGNYTYYCYTNEANPQIVLDVNEAYSSGTIISTEKMTTANTSYPTKSEVEETSTFNGWVTDSDGNYKYQTNEKNEKVKVASTKAPTANVYLKSTYVGKDIYKSYLSNGMGTNMSVTYADGAGNADVTYGYDKSNAQNTYYNRKSQVVLAPNFSTSGIGDKATVSYTIYSCDDTYDGGNVANKSALAGKSMTTIPTATAGEDGKSITIIVEYHKTDKLSATGQQVEGDAYLNQYHLIRTSGGATTSDLPNYGDSVYTVNDATYDYTNYGSFTYTFAAETTVEQAIATIKSKDFSALYANYQKYTAAYNAARQKAKSLGTSYLVTFNENFYKYCEGISELSALQQYGLFIGTNMTIDSSGTTGSGLGFLPWGSNYSFNYYPASGAYTYVHLVDRWGNVHDSIIKTPNIDANSAKLSTASNTVSVLEIGGSGVDTITLSGATVEFITDSTSSLNGDVFTTSGNTVKLSTGVANKSYQLTVTDNATNASTQTVTSNDEGIIVLTVEDKAYDFDGLYTFTLNGTTVNLYDGATPNMVLDASVSGTPTINTNAVVNVKVNGSPEIVRLVEKGNPTNSITFQRDDATINSADGTENWQVRVYVDKLTSTYYVYAKYSDGESSNYVELTIFAREGNDLTIHSMVVSDMVGNDGVTAKSNNGRISAGRHTVTITTTTDVWKLQFVDSNGSTWTYDSRNANIISDADGVRTWTISLNFCTYGNWNLTVRTRSTTTGFASGVSEDLSAVVL